MSKFLFTVWPLTGHIHPNLAIATELKKLGHRVAFYTGSRARGMVEGAGFECFPLRKVDENLIEEMFLSPRGIQSASANPFRLRDRWRQCVLDSVPAQLEDLEEIVASWHPDAVVCDPTMWAPFLVLSESRRIPVAIFGLVPACHLSGRDGPILGFPLPRARTRLERLRARLLRGLSDFFLRPVRRDASRLRASHGLSPLDCSVTDFAGRMPLYLVPGSPEFDYHRTDLPPSVHYVGPCLWKGSKDESLPEWVAGLPPDQPLIYASEGTVQLRPVVLRAVAQGLAGLPVQVILTTGKHRDPATLDLGVQPLPPNIHVAQWIPLTPLLKKLSAMVTIGGPSTMMAAFEAGVPVVVVPFTWDHPETGWRVAESRAGIHLQPKQCTPERMRVAVERVLREPGFRQNAQRLARSFERCGGAVRAAELIAALVPENRKTA
ncbi:MAG TPA: nucleotide disphospho-sugar-binding domain-containing protein [Bryobacteraceae bacterium]|nr:nucleotide disphospho-sugar-binding domain-containing protein [Bryobacteraceae bacterium]